jgi:tetraprenyl-beta-curcumene synthase
VFALISAAARPTIHSAHVTALDSAYFPWIGSLHTLLDSLIDEPEDAITDQHCLTALYASNEDAASRLKILAVRATEYAQALPDGDHHTMMLAAMVSFYLAGAQGRDPRVKLAAEAVLAVFGNSAAPAMLVLRARHIAKCLTDRDGHHRWL